MKTLLLKILCFFEDLGKGQAASYLVRQGKFEEARKLMLMENTKC